MPLFYERCLLCNFHELQSCLSEVNILRLALIERIVLCFCSLLCPASWLGVSYFKLTFGHIKGQCIEAETVCIEAETVSYRATAGCQHMCLKHKAFL